MLAAKHSQPLLQPNVLYLEEKPPKIVKKQKSTRREQSIKNCIKRKTISKSRRSGIRRKKAQPQYTMEEQKKFDFNRGDKEAKIEKADSNDPLFTTRLEFKRELSVEIIDSNTDYFDSKYDKNYCVEQYKEDDDKEFQFKGKWEQHNSFSEDEHGKEEKEEGFEDEDEPLILLTQTSASKSRKKKKACPPLYNCAETCKHKCTVKFNKQRRIDIFDYYIHLSKEDKMNFIRKHIRKPVIQRICNKKRRNNYCYFMKCYKIGQTATIEQPDPKGMNNISNYGTEDLTKVCRKFFEGTLGISSPAINKAVEGYELQPERIVLPIRKHLNVEETKLAEKSKKTQKPQQFLDPETGDLSDTRPKQKTQRRKRGEPTLEHFPKPINCSIRCIYKCHQNFSEEERKQICDSFWTLDFKRRKDFILARIETTDVKSPLTPEFRKSNRPARAYQTKFYLRSGLKSENKRVCKHFMMNTLSINRFFIENAIEFADKTTGSYTGTDRRGTHSPHNKLPQELIQIVKDHINSYPCWLPNQKSKTKYLHYNLSIKKMYTAYKEKCLAEQQKYVSSRIYYKVFHEDFRLLFLTGPDPKKRSGFLQTNPHISHYTGEELGGYWIDSKGNKLDILRLNNPAQSVNICQYSVDRSFVPNTSATNVVDPTSSMQPLKLVVNPSSSVDVVKSYLNPALF
ncbi:uncharacterized protein LOC135956367 [Calliphora vicina]|uniref:uncharacterized protein LOC135956367 n=1 Tax=Calliphora vicina TaxID=7373 RepID=UPI00325B0E11